MLSYTHSLIASMLWNRPTIIVTGIAALAVIGVIAGTAVPLLLRRRRKISLPAMGRLPLALLLFCLDDLVLLRTLPRVRFLCPPEIVSVELKGAQ